MDIKLNPHYSWGLRYEKSKYKNIKYLTTILARRHSLAMMRTKMVGRT